MKIGKTEGITLQSISYKENSKIITIFTKEKGIISLIIKNISSKNPRLLAIASSFCLADFIYYKGKSDIYFFKDANILDSHLFLRKNFTFITTAFSMVKAIIKSQLPYKKTNIYILFKKFLKKLKTSSSPKTLICGFLLKILFSEGMIHLKKNCNICNKKTNFICSGESLCQEHKKNFALNFSQNEIEKMIKLIHCKKFSDLDKIKIENPLKEKIENLFQALFC